MCENFNLEPSKEFKAVFSLYVTPDKLSGLVDDVGIVKQEDLDISLAQKVDKVDGKSLVEDTEIQRLSTLENYNDSQIKQDISNIKSNLNTKVDKVDGKQLSTNDFTDALKSKLDSVDAKSKVYSVNGQTGDVKINEYTLPVASTTTLGGVKVDGTTITINNGVISSSGGSGETGTTNYNDLLNKPQINGVELSGNKTLDNLGIQAKGDYALNSNIPTKTSQLTNDSGFITKEDIGDVDVTLPVLEEAQQIIDKYAVANLILDSENIKSYPSVVDGYLNASGDINPSSTRGASDYIDLAEYPLGIHIKSGVAGIKDGEYTYACFYDENKKFILNLVGVHGNIGEQDIFSYPQNAKYIRFTLTAKGTPLKLMAYYGDKYYDYDIARETDLNVLSEEVSTLNEKIGDFDVNNMPDTTEINKFLSDYAEIVLSETTESYSSIVNAFLNYNGTEVSSSTRGVTDYIDLSLYPVGLHIVSGVSAIQNGAKTYACFYDKDKVFVSNLAHTASTTMDGTDILEYPENAKYIRFTCTANTTPMVVSSYVLTGDFDIARKKEFDDLVSKKVDNQKSYGKSIGVFGGSLSVRQESNVAKQIWKDTLDVSVTSYGVGGAGFSSLTGTTSIQAQVDGAGVHDIYILWASTNDCTSSKEIGEWTDYTRFDNYDESKLTTQCGGINYCIKKLYEINPNAEIYFFTSLRFFSAEYGYNPYSTSTNGAGRTFAEYVEAQKKCCEYHGIPVLDQFNLQGVNLFNYSLYYNSDKLHMNEDGYRKIGHIQAEFLKNGKGKALPNRVYSVNGQTGAVTIDVPDVSSLVPKVVEDSTSTTATIAKAEANTTYKYGTLTSLTVTEVENSPLPITVIFTTATSSPTINLPATLESINLADGFEAEKKYVLAVENNIAVIGSIE